MTMNYVQQTILAGLIIGSVGFGPIGCTSAPTTTVPQPTPSKSSASIDAPRSTIPVTKGDDRPTETPAVASLPATTVPATSGVTGETSQTALPFVGTKRFNFLNGSGTGQSITIEADGTTTVKLHGTANTSVSYSGPFTNPIIFKDGDGVKLEGDTIYSLRTDGTIAEGCIRADEPCKSELN
jgi:hypothetical protein